MEVFENYMVFFISSMAIIALVNCFHDDNQQSNNHTSTGHNGFDHQQFYEEMLKLHNDARKIHGAKPLKLSEKLSKEAMDYLDKVIEGKVNLREMCWYYNLYISEKIEVTAEKIFNFSYASRRGYDYSIESKFKLADSFTQIVWKSTKEVGFAIVFTAEKVYFSAIYKPIGNETGKYAQNVGRPKNNQSIRNCLPCMNP